MKVRRKRGRRRRRKHTEKGGGGREEVYIYLYGKAGLKYRTVLPKGGRPGPCIQHDTSA